MAKQKIVTQEEIDKNQLHQVLENIDRLPEPTYFYKVGDKVSIGNLQDVIILEVLEGGKVYKIDYTDVDNNYGNPIIKKHQTMYWNYLHIRPRILENHNLINDNSLQLNYGQRQLESIFSGKYYFGIEMEPEYQRDYVWELSDKQLLIDSIFNNIDIGKFVFVHLEWDDHPLHYTYEVLDGKQRINALCEYYENKFSYKGLFYNDLSKKERNHFDSYPISFAEVKNITKKQKLQYFLKLNRTGKVMSVEQLNKVENMLNYMKT